MFNSISVFVDFDHTLFNTDEFFHVDIRNIVCNFGIDEKCWDQTYEISVKSGYALDKHIDLACQHMGCIIAPDKIKIVVADFLKDLRRYLFADVIPFFEAQRDEADFYLLSFGNPEWQRRKVDGCGIGKYFKDLLFTAQPNSKASMILSRINNYANVIAVDDNPRELDLIKDSYPSATTYCINRVPDEFVEPKDKLSELKFLKARKYLNQPSRYQHKKIKTLYEIEL